MVNWIWIGLGFGVFYWILESIRDVLAFEKGTIVERIFLPDPMSFWMRLLVLCILVLFSLYMQLLREKLDQGKREGSRFFQKMGVIKVGFVFGAFYWILESLRDVLLSRGVNLFERILLPDPMSFWMRMLAVFVLLLFSIYVQSLIEERKQAEDRLARLNECFLAFGSHPVENINHLVAVCGKLMGGSFALYSRLDGDLLCSIGQWNTSPDFDTVRVAKGHLCYDVIRRAEDRLMVVRDLPDTSYAKTVASIVSNSSQTYVGQAVKFGNTFQGALCVVFEEDFVPRKEDEWLMGVIASSIAVEEERREVEETLRESEEKYRTLTENVNSGIFRSTPGPEGKFIEANPSMVRMFGYDSREEFLEVSVTDRFQHSEDREWFDQKMMGDGFVKDGGLLMKKKDGTTLWCSVTAVAVCDEKGKVKYYYDGVIDDISERKRAEETIKASLKEKEILLKEVHHRVKNNLQVISSLLSLQSQHIKNRQAREMFQESRNRVRSMALIHEKLYGSDDFARVDFSGYIQGLARGLYRSYGVDPERIGLDVQVEEVSLGIDLAVPCGLIINELMANALKYAFPPSWEGRARIGISVRADGDGEIELILKDNGVGMPQNFDLRKTDSLGLYLVVILVEDQLEGEITLDRRGGATFQIKFKGT